MQDHPILSQVVLGYSPMIDRRRAVVATRLTVFPERLDAASDPKALLAALAEVWPAPEGGPLSLTLRELEGGVAPARSAPAALPPVVLNVAGEALLHALMAASPGPHLMIEVPAFMAADPAHADVIRGLYEAGSTLLIKGRPAAGMRRELLACFSHAIVDDETRAEVPAPGMPPLQNVQSGVRTPAAMDAAFQRGAAATLGWPLDDTPLPTARKAAPQDVQTVLALISGVDRELPVSQLEPLLKKDPALAFRLMRYLNSPAFGLTAEISSFGHALMMLGYARLKRWLALLLASSSKEPHARPLMFAAVRRGLLMEELGRAQGDAEMRGELFICGVFSLLDRLLRQPFDELLPNLPVPERVQQALLHDSGPFQPYLALVLAIEQESRFDIRELSEKLLMSQAEVNHALLKALAAARQLD